MKANEMVHSMNFDFNDDIAAHIKAYGNHLKCAWNCKNATFAFELQAANKNLI